MTARTTPPFRADHVGSLLRPQALLDARARHKAGEIDADALREVEDAAIRDAVRALGIAVRAGLHTGECEVSDGKVVGIAVSTGARISSLAGPGEVLVSRTVRDLVAGSGLRFEDRGEHRLKGVPDEWQLFALVEA